MSISKIALAIPLSLGIACSTSGTQSKSEHTGAMWTESQHRDAATQAYMQGTGSQGEQEKAGGGGSAASSDTGSSSGSMGSSGSTGSSGAAGSSDSGSMGSSGSSGSMGSSGSSDQPSGGAMGSGGSSESMGSSGQGAGGSTGSTDQGTTGGSSAQHDSASGSGGMAHSDDQMLRGKVSKVSKEEISITPKGGEAKTLKISPQTVVTINGKDAKPTQLKQGQQVRASYANQDGDDVAVKIEVGKSRQGKSGGHMKGGHSDHAGHSGSSDSGSTGGSGGSMGGSTGSDTGGGSR